MSVFVLGRLLQSLLRPPRRPATVRLRLEPLDPRVTPAAIVIDSLPNYAQSGLVRGHVTGVDPAAVRVAPYIYVDGLGWYTKPTFATPTVPINGDGSFSVNVVTGGLDAYFTNIQLDLVPAGDTPPQANGSGTVPPDPNAVAVVAAERYGHLFQWRGHTWAIKDGPLPVGPNSNYFSSLPSDVFVDAAGNLHLTMHNHDGHWWATEVILVDPVGPGTFVVRSATNFNTLDANVTAGEFTWDAYGDDPAIPTWPYRELDIEHSRWGNPADPTDSQFVVQPYYVSGNWVRFRLPDQSADPTLTELFHWQPDRVTFTSLQGYQDPFNYPPESLASRYEYTNDPSAGHVVPTDGREHFRFNLWVNGGGAPSDGQPVDFVISDFAFIPDGAAPVTVAVDQAGGQSDPANGPVQFAVHFSEPVTGFTAADVDLGGSTVGGSLSAAVSGSGADYVVTVSGMSGAGTVVARVPAGAAAAASGVLNLPSTSTDNVVTFDDGRPAVTVARAAGQPDPTNAGPVLFDVTFGEPVSGFTAADVSFAGSTVGGTPAAAVTGSGANYTVSLSGMTGTGSVVVSVPAGAAVDSAGNANTASTGTANVVRFDDVPPTVTIGPAPGQPDPAFGGPIRFAVGFSEPVTGFDASDVSFAGSTVGGTLSATVTGSGASYTVSVTGMSGTGTVVLGVPAGAAVDAAGNASTASTGSGNAVAYDGSGRVGFTAATYTVIEEGGLATVTVTRTGDGVGPVSVDYATGTGTAVDGLDYTGVSGTLSWADGETGDKTFTVPILDDGRNEGKETVPLALSNLTGGAAAGTTAAVLAIAPSDGVVVGTPANSPSAEFTDADGDLVTVRLGGRVGTATVFLTDPDGDGQGPIELIQLDGTLPDPLRPRAVLSVTVAKARTSVDGGTVGLGAVTGSGLLRIAARKANLDGDGISLNGYLGSLLIGNIQNGAYVTSVASANPRLRTGINALAIGGGTGINIGGPVSALRATSFGAGSLTAPSVGLMVVTGDLAADLNVTGAGVDPSKKALGTLRVKGSVNGSDIAVNGNVGAVSAGSFLDSRLFAGYTGPDDGSGSFAPTGTVGSFRVSGTTDAFANGHVIATGVSSAYLRSVKSANGGVAFGFVVRDALGRLTIGTPPIFSYGPLDGGHKALGDLAVTVV